MISELHMWLTFGVIAGAMLLYVTEFVAIEMTSLLALVAMRSVHPVSADWARRLKSSGRDRLIGRLWKSGADHSHGVIGYGARTVSIRCT